MSINFERLPNILNSNFTDIGIFYPLVIVDRGSDTQFQVGQNLKYITLKVISK